MHTSGRYQPVPETLYRQHGPHQTHGSCPSAPLNIANHSKHAFNDTTDQEHRLANRRHPLHYWKEPPHQHCHNTLSQHQIHWPNLNHKQTSVVNRLQVRTSDPPLIQPPLSNTGRSRSMIKQHSKGYEDFPSAREGNGSSTNTSTS